MNDDLNWKKGKRSEPGLTRVTIELENPRRISPEEIGLDFVAQFDILLRRLDTGTPRQLREIGPEHDLLPPDRVCKLDQFLYSLELVRTGNSRLRISRVTESDMKGVVNLPLDNTSEDTRTCR